MLQACLGDPAPSDEKISPTELVESLAEECDEDEKDNEIPSPIAREVHSGVRDHGGARTINITGNQNVVIENGETVNVHLNNGGV